MKKYIALITIIVSVWFDTIGQTTPCNCTLKGVVHEKDIHQAVPGAIIYLKSTNISTFADANGKYFFKNLCQGKYILTCQAVGFQKVEVIINLTQEHDEDFSLEDKDEHLQEVIVTGKKVENIIHFMQNHPSQKITSSNLSHTYGGKKLNKNHPNSYGAMLEFNKKVIENYNNSL